MWRGSLTQLVEQSSGPKILSRSNARIASYGIVPTSRKWICYSVRDSKGLHSVFPAARSCLAGPPPRVSPTFRTFSVSSSPPIVPKHSRGTGRLAYHGASHSKWTPIFGTCGAGSFHRRGIPTTLARPFSEYGRTHHLHVLCIVYV